MFFNYKDAPNGGHIVGYDPSYILINISTIVVLIPIIAWIETWILVYQIE